jgi:putative inorganic carbon (HCO3(-)) transporter
MKGLLFTYLLTYGGATASLFNPFLGLLIYVCFAIIKPESMWFWEVPQGNYSRIVAIGLLCGWAMKGFGNWRLERAKIVVVALLGFFSWSVLSALTSPDAQLAWGFVEEMAKIVLPFLVGITTIDSARKLNQLIWVILLSQGYVAYELNLSYLGGFNFLTEVGFGGMDNNSVAIAMVTCVGLGFFVSLATDSWWRRGLAFALMALMIHAVLFSFSRGGMLALIVTGAVAYLLIPKRPVHYISLVLAIALGLRLAGPEVTNRFLTTFDAPEQRDASAAGRVQLWSACIDSMLKHPLTGVGPNHWGLMVAQYGFEKGKLAHTLWLQIGAELGIPGLFFLALFYGSCMLRLWPLARQRFEGPDAFLGHCARMVIASLTGFVVAAQFVSLSGLEVPFYIVLIGAGALKLQSLQSGAEGVAELLPSDQCAVGEPGELGLAKEEEPAQVLAFSGDRLGSETF